MNKTVRVVPPNLFPACAGVILVPVFVCHLDSAFPRLRGGDPFALLYPNVRASFSPPARG